MPSPTAAEARGSLHMSSSILPAPAEHVHWAATDSTDSTTALKHTEVMQTVQDEWHWCHTSILYLPRSEGHIPASWKSAWTNKLWSCGHTEKKTATNLGSLSEFSVPNKVILNCNIEFVWPCTKLWVFRMQLWFKVWLFWIRLVSKPFKNQFSYKLRKE